MVFADYSTQKLRKKREKMMRRFSSSIITKTLTQKHNTNNPFLPFLNQTHVLSSSIYKTPFVTFSHFSSKPFFPIAATAAVEDSAFLRRSFCSDTDPTKTPIPTNFMVVDSEETFSDSLRKVQVEEKPGILYFTAAWCGPCRFMSPVLEKLSETYPHVTTYKIDIDQEALDKKISELSITAVPTLHFFKDGKKASELVGFDVKSLKETLANLYD